MSVREILEVRPFIMKNNISESVYVFLREAILKGDFIAGQELNQVEIANSLGVSRIPVREALRQLASEGLVDMPPYKQAVVTSINEELLEELFEIRIVLECLALKHSIRNMSMVDIEKLKEIIHEMDNINSHDEWLRLNQQFHETLYQKSGKKHLCGMINGMRDNAQRFMYKNSSQLVREVNANEEHKEILQACEDRKIELALELLENHLQSTLMGMKQVLYKK